MAVKACPLCQSRKMQWPGILYEHVVCRRCWKWFIRRRYIAWLLDVLILQIVAGAVVGAFLPEAPWLIVGVVYAGVLFKDGFHGYSPGKAICGLQVVRTDGTPAGFTESYRRNWIMVFPFIPIVVALTMIHGPRLGDGMARTRVILSRHRRSLVFSSLPAAAATRVFE